MLTEFKSAAIIGSRDTPSDKVAILYDIAYHLAKAGTVMFSGGAKKADDAGERGYKTAQRSNLMNIILPDMEFNGREHDGVNYFALETYPEHLIKRAELLVQKVHPFWPLTGFPYRAHCRNCFQVLGHDLMTPVDVVIFWAPKNGNSVKGGTRTAVEIAKMHGIPTYNLNDPHEREQIMRMTGVTETSLDKFW